jgi:alpha-beta hydrolase superfamily lysophospholipase
MRPEYDFSSMRGGVRGKYVSRYREGSNLVRLDPKIAEVFSTDASVNEALRAVLKMTEAVQLRKKAATVKAVKTPDAEKRPRRS